MARDPFYDLVSKMGKGRRDKVANAAGKPVIPPSAPGNVAMTDPMISMSAGRNDGPVRNPQRLSMNGINLNPDMGPLPPGFNMATAGTPVDMSQGWAHALGLASQAQQPPPGVVQSNPTPNPAMGPGGRPGVAKSGISGGASGASGGNYNMGDGPPGSMSSMVDMMGTYGGGNQGYDGPGMPSGRPSVSSYTMPERPSGPAPSNPMFGEEGPGVNQGWMPGQGWVSVNNQPSRPSLPSPPPVEPLGPIGYSPNTPARDPFASLFGGSIPTPQSKPSRFDDAMNSFAPTLQPTVGQIMQGPAGVFGKPTRFGPNPPAPPPPKPSPWPTPQPNPMRGIGGPDLMMAGPQGGVSPDRMGEFGEFGTDPFGYGGLTGQMGDGTSAGVMGGGFANAGYGSPSYGVNPVTAGHDFAAAQQEGFSYGGYNPSDPTGAGATGGGSSKVVCTAMNEAYGFGGFRQAIWLAYSAKHMRPEHERGYHAIFVPLLAYARGGVSLPRQAMWLSLAHIARHRTADIRAEMRGGKRDRLGRMYRAVLEPLCYVVGKVLG